MRRCPSCYAFLRELTKPTLLPGRQLRPTDSLPEGSRAKVRYECGQCGHSEELQPGSGRGAATEAQ